MSDMTRRNFLTAVPLAGVAAGAALTTEFPAPGALTPPAPASPSVPQLGSPLYVSRKRNQADPKDRGGLVLKISGLTVTRIRTTANTARTYFLDLPAAGYARHFPQLIFHKDGLDAASSDPDSVTATLAIYNLKGGCRIEGPAGTLALTMGSMKDTCADAYKPGLNAFLQPKAGMGWTYDAASDQELEARSTAWIDMNRGQFEAEADVAVGDPTDAATLITDGTVTRVVKRILYYGIPVAEKISFTLGGGRKVTVDARTYQIVAGLAHIPLHEHKEQKAPQKLVDFGVLRQLMRQPADVPELSVVEDCKAGQHLDCVCCDPVVEFV